MRQVCPACASEVCSSSGHSESVLIIGEFPGKEEMKQNRPFASNSMFMSAGKVFRKELEHLGASLNDYRCCNLWLHETNDNENCYQAGFNNVLAEAKGKQVILLVGSSVVEAFTNYKVSDVNGLQVDSAILSAPIIYAMVNPALALHRAVGEVRFGITKFVQRLEKEGLL